MILSSLFLGYPGKYRLGGIDIAFKPTSDQNSAKDLSEKIYHFFYYSTNILTFNYLHTFIHEMGHALVYKIHDFTNEVSVEISTSGGLGKTSSYLANLSTIESSICYLNGPLSSVICSISIIFTALVLKNSIGSLITSVIIIGGSFNILDEISMIAISILGFEQGDFKRIAKNGHRHLLASVIIMVGVIVLGILAINRVL